MKGKRNVFRKLAAGVLAMALLAAPAQAASPEIRVGSYKGNELSVGERSALIIGPSGAAYTASSSNPEVVAVEQVLSFWVAVAKAEGSAEITVTNGSGAKGQLMLNIGEAPPPAGIDLSANMDIRLEMVGYINQVRRENGRPELPIEESLMNAAQDVSAQQVREHRPYDHQALIRYGWPHGGMYNLNVFSPNAHPDIARKAVEDWVNSPGYLETLLMEEGSCVGTGVTISGPWVYCYMVVGDPTAHNPYE